MKYKIYQENLQKVADLFGVESDEILSKTKKRRIVDARYLLFYVCHQRPMRLSDIQDYLEQDGLRVGHSSIHYGIQQVKDKIESDKITSKKLKSYYNDNILKRFV